MPKPPPEAALAKVNLYLHVLGRRSDGYHDLQSLVLFADAGDHLSVAGRAAEWALSVEGPFAHGLRDTTADENLVLRAARRLSAATEGTTPLSLRLMKRLPVAAGIGGGSADAAAAVRLLARIWGADAGPPGAWADLGADIPVCLLNRPALVQGMGEQVAPVAGMPDLPAVLVNPGLPSATGPVFAAMAGRYGRPLSDTKPAAGSSVQEVAAWLGSARNDLTAAAVGLTPEIGEILAALAAAPGVLLARMSGSGATCFGLFATAEEAETAAVWLRTSATGRWPSQWITATRLRGSPPDRIDGPQAGGNRG